MANDDGAHRARGPAPEPGHGRDARTAGGGGSRTTAGGGGTGPAAAGGGAGVLVLGEINPDVIVTDPDPRPAFGQVERSVAGIELTIGSSSAIFACGLARLGMGVGFYGAVGDDAFGRFMLDALAERGIDVSACVVLPGMPTGASVILASPRDRAILTAVGAIDGIDLAAVPRALVLRARHLHVGSWFLQARSHAGLPGLFADARASGLTTSLDCNWDPDDAWTGVDAMLAHTDVFLPNAAEATRLTGLDDVEAAAWELLRRAPSRRAAGQPAPTVAVKLGRDGALAVSGDEVVRVPALAVDVVDTTGAGDSFGGGFVHGWLAGWPLRAALELAVACGSLSCRRPGGTSGQPTLDEARGALAEMRR